MPRALLTVVVVLIAVVATVGCGSSGQDDASENHESVDLVDAPVGADVDGLVLDDYTGSDGGDAQADLEASGLTVTLIAGGADEDLGGRQDATGCEVTDQTPAPGEPIADGDDIELSVDCRDTDWDAQTGDEWDAYATGFEEGYGDGCRALFALSPDGSLYDDDTEYTSLDCPILTPDPDPPGLVPADPGEAGMADGFDAGCDAVFEQEIVFTLYYGDTAVSSEDCQQTNPHGEVKGASGRTSKPNQHPVASPCEGEAGGARVKVTDIEGDVRCDGALALWSVYLQAAPHGTGSGGAVQDIDGWDCIAAPSGAPDRLGSCNRSDGSAAFTIRPA